MKYVQRFSYWYVKMKDLCWWRPKIAHLYYKKTSDIARLKYGYLFYILNINTEYNFNVHVFKVHIVSYGFNQSKR